MRSIGFHFDTITSHAEGVGIPDTASIRVALDKIEWLEQHGSIYAAQYDGEGDVSRRVLMLMGEKCNFRFVDAINWVTCEIVGDVTRPATKHLTEDDLPDAPIPDRIKQLLESRARVPLDNAHKGMLELGRWNSEYHVLLANTKDLPATGIFQTTGGDCFMVPMFDGAWKVYHTELKVEESPIWAMDDKGWVSCYYNRPAGLREACLSCEGVEDTNEKGGYVLSASNAVKAAGLLKQVIELPRLDKQVTLRTHKDGRLIVAIPKKDNEKENAAVPKDWLDKKTRMEKIFRVKLIQEESDDEDDIIRATVTPAEKFAEWYIRDRNKWVEHPPQHVKMVLQSHNHSRTEAEIMMGEGIRKEWELVSLPFQPEHPGGRQWNRDAAQLRYKPADLDGEIPYHPNWDKIYDHVGQELDAPLKELQWADKAGIKTGGDYLRAWSACVFRFPFEQLPYLFLWGEEESGKSIFWESFEVLMTKGVVKADKALTSQSDFNGELVGAIICAVDEIDLNGRIGAMAKIRDAVTTKTLSIRQMRTDTYQIPNMTHWIQCGNKRKNCPIPEGDTRAIVAEVLKPQKDIPKSTLLADLHKEAPHFLHTLLTLPLPPVIKRLRLPIVTTASKVELKLSTLTMLECFVVREYTYSASTVISSEDLREHYQQYCDSNEIDNDLKSEALFGRALLEIGDGRIKTTRPRIDGVQVPSYRGLKRRVKP